MAPAALSWALARPTFGGKIWGLLPGAAPSPPSCVPQGGFGIMEEMCVNYVHYYPQTQLELCKSAVDPGYLHRYFSLVNRYGARLCEGERGRCRALCWQCWKKSYKNRFSGPGFAAVVSGAVGGVQVLGSHVLGHGWKESCPRHPPEQAPDQGC